MSQHDVRTSGKAAVPVSAQTTATGALGQKKKDLLSMNFAEGRKALSPGDDAVAVAGGKPALETETVAGTLWAKDKEGKDLDPAPEDVAQGGLCDCFLMAALASLANTKPGTIKGMITDNASNYTVRFAGIGWFSAHTQTVDGNFAKGKRANVGPRAALWPLVVEKAYAAEKGGVDVLDKGGNPGEAAKHLTDKGRDFFAPGSKDGDTVLSKLEGGKTKKAVMTALAPKKTDATEELKKLADDQGLHFWHSYAIMDVKVKERQVKLYNPWGYDHPNGSGWISVDDLRKFFIEVDING